MKAVNQQAPAGKVEDTEFIQAFLNELLTVLQTLQVQLQKVPPSEKSTESFSVVRRLQVADAHWVASLVELEHTFPGRLLVLEARHRRPDWTRLVQLRRERLLDEMPLLVILEQDDPQVITQAYQMGADACLVRPVNPAQLLGIALYLVRKGRRRAA